MLQEWRVGQTCAAAQQNCLKLNKLSHSCQNENKTPSQAKPGCLDRNTNVNVLWRSSPNQSKAFSAEISGFVSKLDVFSLSCVTQRTSLAVTVKIGSLPWTSWWSENQKGSHWKHQKGSHSGSWSQNRLLGKDFTFPPSQLCSYSFWSRLRPPQRPSFADRQPGCPSPSSPTLSFQCVSSRASLVGKAEGAAHLLLVGRRGMRPIWQPGKKRQFLAVGQKHGRKSHSSTALAASLSPAELCSISLLRQELNPWCRTGIRV